MASVSGTQEFCGLVVTTSQLADITTLRARGETDQKIVLLIKDDMLEFCAASARESAAAPAPSVRTFTRFNPDSILPAQEKLLVELFHCYVQQDKSSDAPSIKDEKATKTLKALMFEANQTVEGLETILISMREVNPVHIMEHAVASRTQPGGLFNVGNTCWLNSTLQAFFKTDAPYFDALMTQSENPDNSNRAAKLLQIIYLSNEKVTPAINEKLYGLITAFVDDLYKEKGDLLTGKGHQEDADSGFRALIAYLGLYDVTSKQSPIRFSQLRHGLVTSTESTTEGATEALVSLKQIDTLNPENSIQELLDLSHMRLETLTGDNQCYFDREPESAEDTLKINYLSVGETPPKLGDAFPISAPRFINERNDAGEYTSHKDATPVYFNPQMTLPLYDKSGSSTQCVVELSLQSIVCHNGVSAESGHYITYTRNENGTYTQYNDTQVTAGIPLGRIQEELSQDGYIATYVVTKVDKPALSASQPSVTSLIQNPSGNSDSGVDSPGATPSPPPSEASPRGVSPESSLAELDEVTLAKLLSLDFSQEELKAIKSIQGEQEFKAFVEALVSPDDDEDFYSLPSSRAGSPVPGAKV